MMDLEQFEGQAARLEYSDGEPRFRAETIAAAHQGYRRGEFLDAIERRDSEAAQNRREAVARHSQDAVPGVQRHEAQQGGPLPERDVQD
jgi:hypothetical protein